jgi:hypothetical protein
MLFDLGQWFKITLHTPYRARQAALAHGFKA